jgi:hypothetical protein
MTKNGQGVYDDVVVHDDDAVLTWMSDRAMSMRGVWGHGQATVLVMMAVVMAGGALAPRTRSS